MGAHIFKALVVSAVFSAGLAAMPARGLDAEKWAEAHPDVTILSDPSEDGLMMIEASGATLEDFTWTARPLIVFADSENDPRFIQQMEYIEGRWEDLAERDVVVVIDTDPSAASAIRTELRPRGFMLVLIGKDGFKYLRKPLPWDVREISRSIDKMPMRQQELKDMRAR